MNMIESAKAQVRQLTVAAYEKAAAAGMLPAGIAVEPAVEIPKDTTNGDYTTTFCLAAAKAMTQEPRVGSPDAYRPYDADRQLFYLRGDRRSRLYELPAGRKVVQRHRLRH